MSYRLSCAVLTNPDTIVENMDGAGSLIAANYLYSKAPRDGSVISVFNSAMVLRQALRLCSRGRHVFLS